MTDTGNSSAADLLYGAHAIAEFLGIKPRAAYHLIETRRIPFFKIGKDRMRAPDQPGRQARRARGRLRRRFGSRMNEAPKWRRPRRLR